MEGIGGGDADRGGKSILLGGRRGLWQAGFLDGGGISARSLLAGGRADATVDR